MEFDPNGIKVTLIRGCVELRTKKGTSGEIVNEQGRSLAKTDPAKDSKIERCEPRDVRPPATFAIIEGAAADTGLLIAILVNRGRNPSPGSP